MALSVVEGEYKLLSHKVARVIMEAPTREELTHMDARLKAMEYAQSRHFNARGINNIPSPYPVNDAGETTDGLLHGLEKIASWRAEVDVAA